MATLPGTGSVRRDNGDADVALQDAANRDMGSRMLSVAAIAFPAFDPVALWIGPLPIRWYSLAYIAGFGFGWWYARRLLATDRLWPGGTAPAHPNIVDDAIVWAALCGILGGRLAFILIYDTADYAADPWAMLRIWEGGMSFHGGILGTVAGLWIAARRAGMPTLSLLDLSGVVAPIGIALGRLANFVNQELWGRVADVPWAVIFPRAGVEPRHPSQLYQAGLEGVLLFVVLAAVAWRGGLRRPGLLAGLFGVGYAVTRSLGEVWREPDPQLGFLPGGLTMGQLLSLPVAVGGAVLIALALRRPRAP
jgi:phosphatidylglycerol---prolipoprotein diacylglyceryl transferase